MTRDPNLAPDLLNDVAYFVEDDDGNMATVFDGEVVHAELVDEPDDFDGAPEKYSPAPVTAWLPTVPELDPRRRAPDEANPIADEVDAKLKFRKRQHKEAVALQRIREQDRLNEMGYRDRLHRLRIEPASALLNQIADRG